jgi:TANFOR domain-containing protein
MFSHFKKYGILVFFLIQFINNGIFAQPFTQAISVMPPYSNKLADYTNSPNKILDVITAVYSEMEMVNIYFEGSIRSVSGDIEISTKPGHKPSFPITLKRVSRTFMPYTLQYSDIQQIFDNRWLVYKGVTREEVIKNGLPEGSYQICFKIFDFYSGKQEGDQACSNIFNVASIEAPIIIQPANNAELPFMQTQNLVFSWVTPPGAPANAQYKLRIVELNENGPNPADALRSVGYPVFFETTVTGNTYLYSVANPALSEGKKYAFVVTAIDPLGRTLFRNKGASEIYSFTYKAPMQTRSKKGTPSSTTNVQSAQIPACMQLTHIAGVLKSKYQEDGNPNEAKVLRNVKIKLIAKYVRREQGSSEIAYVYDKNSKSSGTITSNEHENCILDEVMDVQTTNDNGEFNFSFLTNYKTGLIGTIDCEHIAYNNLSEDYPFLANNNRKEKGPHVSDLSTMNGLSGASAYHGTCELYRYFVVEIESPHHNYYLNPDQNDSYFFTADPGQTKNVGEVISLIKSFNLDLTVNGSTSWMAVNTQKYLSGLNVYIFRKINFNYPVIFPSDDVAPNITDNFPLPVKEMTLVGRTVTDDNGVAHFSRLVLHNNPDYQYYYYINSDRTGTYNYAMDAEELLDMGKIVNSSKTQNYASLLVDFSARDYFDSKKNFTLTKALHAKLPTIKVHVFEKEGQKSINDPGAVVSISETYIPGQFTYQEGGYFKVKDKDRTLVMAKVDTGLFVMNDLWTQETADGGEITGPIREVKVSVPGFSDTTISIKQGKPLKLGEQAYLDVQMRYGAMVTGTITDAETKKPLPNAYLKIVGSSKSAKTNNQGVYSFEARLLNEKKQMVFSAEGYINDTIPVYINKIKKVIDRTLYKKMRRLDFKVFDPQLGKGVQGIAVTLPDVKVAKATHVNYIMPQYLNANAGQDVGATIQLNESKSEGIQGRSSVNLSSQANKTLKPAQDVNIGGSVSVEEVPYTEFTDADGYAHFQWSGGEDDLFRIVTTNPESNPKNYPTLILDINVPYAKYSYDYSTNLVEGACLEGTVYVGESNGVPAQGAEVRATIHGQAAEYTMTATTDQSGKYKLRNLPSSIDSKNGRFTLEIVKSGSIGTSIKSYSVSKGATCQQGDFHLKTYAGIDLSTFLGFQFDVTAWEEASDNKGGYVSGKIHLPANNRFGTSDLLEVKHIKVVKSSSKNSNGDAMVEPETLPVVTEVNHFKTAIWNTYQGLVVDSTGISIKANKQDLIGSIDGKVLIYSKNSADISNFGGDGYALPTLYLATTPSGAKRTTIPVFSSNSSFTWPTVGGSGFYVASGEGDSIRYSLEGFKECAFADPTKSFFNKNGLNLNTRLKAVIPSFNPSNIQIPVGNLVISKNGLSVSNLQPFEVSMGNWKLKCNNWTVVSEGLKVSNSTLLTGVDIQIDNLKLTSTQLETDKAVVHLEKIKLLGVQDMNINTSYKGFNYLYLHDGVYGWQVYASPDPGKNTVGYIQGLPGINPSDKVEFTSISINNEGESYFVLNSKSFKLFNMVDFTPNAATLMNVYPTFVKISGVYNLGIPYYEKVGGAMSFFKDGNKLGFKMLDMDLCNFDHKNLSYRMNAYNLTNQLFVAKGTVEEPGNLPKIKITLTKTPFDTKISIDQGEKLDMGTGKSLANLTGGINVVNNQWETFRFEGDLKGMGSIPNQKMSFVAEGAVKASNQNISVSELPAFPGMTFTYDMVNSRFIGTANLDMNLGGMQLTGNVISLMDSKGWLFQADGSMDVPGLGGARMYGMFGNYTGLPAEVASKIGNARCLPNDFKQNMHGFFLTAGITKQVLPRIDWDFGVVSVTAGVDLSVDARTFMTFGQGGTRFGLGVLAEGHAYASGKCKATCTSVTADANLQVGVSGDYNASSHVFSIDGCASASLKLVAEQCVPVLVGCGPCGSLNLASVTLGANMHLDNSSGFSMGITTSSCDQQCK